MEEEKSGGGSPGTAGAEETKKHGTAAAVQNGEQAEEADTRKAGFVRRNSSEPPGKMDAGKTVIPTEEPPRKRFQIPRKTKKALQSLSSDSREFEELLKILHASFLEANSKIHFTYKSAQLVHNEFLEKEFTEKRRQLKFDGRLDKELAESYGFLLVDESQVNNICERGLLVGHSKLITLGKSSMGVYLSKFADLLQANPLEAGTTGTVFIFKIIKGKMKFVYDNFRSNLEGNLGNGSLDPAPKHECHILKNMNAVTSLLSYRAFERTQYYFYEYGFDEILKRPRHVCPYAVVSFGYKTELPAPRPSLSPMSGSVPFNSDRYSVFTNGFIMWRGQLLCNGKLLCFASLKSNNIFLPYKLPEKLDLEIIMRLEQIKKRIPSILFCKETHKQHKEVLKGGIYGRLCEVCDKTRTGNDFQRLLQKLEKENLALVKPLPDGGFLFFYFPTPMGSVYGSQSKKPYPLHALFIYRQSRETLQSASRFKVQPTFTESNEIMPEFLTFLGALHYAINKAHSDTSDNFNIVVEKHVHLYLKRREDSAYKHKDFKLRHYEQGCDEKKILFVAPREKSGILRVVESYLKGSDAYSLLVKRAKELITETRRVQQFSPISDYEPMEEEPNETIVSQATGHDVLPDNSFFDPDRVNSLLNLIQTRKKGNLETDDVATTGVKRKLETSPEAQWKHPKYEDYMHQNSHDPEESAHSLISALGGQDTDLRQENEEEIASEQLLADAEYCKGLFEKLSNSGLLDPKNLLPVQNAISVETSNLDFVGLTSDVPTSVEPIITAPDIGTPYIESTFVESQSENVPESVAAPAAPVADIAQVQNIDDGSDPLPVEDMIQGPYSGYASPCPSTPTEEIYQQQDSNSSNVETEMNWKLIPITGLSVVEEQSVYSPLRDTFPDDPRVHNTKRKGCGYSPLAEYQKGRRRFSQNERAANSDQSTRKGHCFLKTKHCQNGVIESTVQEIYSSFSERLQEVLREKDIAYTAVAAPVLSSDERDVRLSDWLYEHTSSIPVQQYIDELRVKLDSVVNSYLSCPETGRPLNIETEVKETMESLDHGQQQNNLNDHAHPSIDSGVILEPLQSSDFIHNGCVAGKPQRSGQDVTMEEIPVPLAELVPHSTQDAGIQNQETPDITASSTTLANLINQMNPEVFSNLVKIFTHVNKNIVKFYIHPELEENSICQEIKNYLLKLGNVQCSPEQIVNCSESSDKLLIIIQNEDIASSIHKIPSLITLKKQSCVSFAGVDSLDDLKNHTYNELFVSGGFIVSDDTVLNPDNITEDVLKKFLLFLEQIDSPDGKWQWKIHCKFQKKLKELGRLKATALNILTLLNTYQKKHLVEILAYHMCDSQTRQAPELDCLIRLQVQNIQQRHLIFLTEKDKSLFSSHAENGILVTSMDEFINNFTDLIGHHNSSNEEHCLSQLVNQENQKAVSEADLKEEEDMSLDSEDEMPEIEVCTNVKQEPQKDTAMNQSEDGNSQTEKSTKTPIIGPEFMQPITPVSTAGSTTGDHGNPAEDSSSIFNDYDSSSLGISHFNLLTHQTFLGSMVYGNNQTPVENLFISSYGQSDQDTSSGSEWDPKWNVK
ncbi:protein TASOR isoform X2 [Rana temporaria]|uniref:protein TASOR isoform X2 n=1 Tax=Rana temporaria TaxID=8407 RepID=UPI001AACDBDB|nr:protein TASOR isoform X2 [Rana temporaria]